MKVLVIGGGGREHAIAWKLAESTMVEKVFCAPGNGGMKLEKKCENIAISKTEELIDFVLNENIEFTVVGPEVPLVDGIVDRFKEKGLKIFGPSKKAAELEGSKIAAKDFMKKYGVKTAEYGVFEDSNAAVEYLKNCSYPTVIKADGLAAGKGVVICEDFKMAEETINSFMLEDVFKGSGQRIVIEEFLEGVEASILSITDGDTIIPFISAKDHKQIFDGGKGPNTGGMGVITPNPYCTEEVLKSFDEDILKPTLRGIQEENMDYIGIIFFGLMITSKGVYSLEYNVRMGDPETEAVLPLMENDFAELILKAIDKDLKNYEVQWKNKCSCCVIATSKGYPEKYETGLNIEGINNVSNKVFFAGVKEQDGKLKTAGGRVLAVVALGDNMEEARNKAYEDIKKIEFDGIYYRSDIGLI